MAKAKTRKSTTATTKKTTTRPTAARKGTRKGKAKKAATNAADTATTFYDPQTGRTLKRAAALKRKTAKPIATDARGKPMTRTDGTTPRLSTTYRGKPDGRTWGLKIGATWCRLFDENETRKKPLTDAQISKFMHAEFPGRPSLCFDRVSAARARFNANELAGSDEYPDTISSRKG